MEHRQRLLDRIDDPAVRKVLIVRWGMSGKITPAEAEALIRSNALEAV